MATVLIYNNATSKMERYNLSESSVLPYVSGRTMTVAELRGSSNSSVLWTDRRALEAWNAFRARYGQPIHVGFAFKRIWEGGHTRQSQHYAGVSFDVGQNLSTAARNTLRQTAINSGLWSYVEPAYLTPTWVHFDKRTGTPACSTGGYPLLRQGSVGVYVLVLQDALNAAGTTGAGLDGYFGPVTKSTVMRYQRANGLSADGVVGCNTWRSLVDKVVGKGRTSTVYMP